MKRRYFEARELKNLSVEELCDYFKGFKHTRLKELYRFKQEAEDEMERIKAQIESVKAELEAMERQARIDREASSDVPNGTCTLYIH